MAAEDLFNYFVGGLALISAAISAMLYCRAYLPGAQLKILDELLQETRVICDKSYNDGFLPEDLRKGFEEELAEYVIFPCTVGRI